MTNSRPPRDGQRFDVIVIGGGINGVAIARECARAGRRTLLVEQNDFAAGTTSRSTRIIHGGLRYLEHGDLAQVRESLRERHYLAHRYPHLVAPLEFLLTLNCNAGRRSSLAVRAGLWLYRRMGSPLPKTASNGNSQAQLERLLDSGQQFSIFSFEDAQCEFPERLVAEWLVEAIEAGCIARNHTQVLEATVRNGRAIGVRLRDQLNGQEESVESAWIVNATGPWADEVCQSSSIQTKHPMVGGVRGSHLVLPRFAGAPDAAIYTEATDGRPVFVIPWNQQILVGTTEVPDQSDPSRVQPSDTEIQYLLSSLERLFPRMSAPQRDVRYAFAGVRPLPYSPQASPSAISRRHCFQDHADDGAAGMISVVGGKLTTAARLARDCASLIGVSTKYPPIVAPVSESVIEDLLERRVAEVAEQGRLNEQIAEKIVEWFAERAVSIAQLASSDPLLHMPLCSLTEHVVAEAVYAFANEAAVSLADVLLRRVPVALSGDWTLECSREAAVRVGKAMRWDERQLATELEKFQTEHEAFLRKPISRINCQSYRSVIRTSAPATASRPI